MRHLASDGEVRLYQFTEHLLGRAPDNARRMRMCVVDTESTGVNPGTDEVIEVGIVIATWAQLAPETWLLEDVQELPALLQQPSFPIPPGASAVNGIYDADVEGKSFDWQIVYDAMMSCDLTVAFNAPFDRPMIHHEFIRRNIRLPIVPWACALEQIDWRNSPGRPPVRNLEVLAPWNGFFYDAHRAVNDCHATVHLLNVSGQAYRLLETLGQMHYFVFCGARTINTSHNEHLKAVGFRWSPDKKGWWKLCLTDEERDAILDHLQATVYGEHGMGNVKIDAVPATARFL